jgi:predicted RNase H-like HicB family nuclease
MISKRYRSSSREQRTGLLGRSQDVVECAATGETEKETRRDFQEALASHFAAIREVANRSRNRMSVDYVEVLSRH